MRRFGSRLATRLTQRVDELSIEVLLLRVRVRNLMRIWPVDALSYLRSLAMARA
jgi:hypothetical protein